MQEGGMKMKKALKRVLFAILGLVLALVLLVGGYVAYLMVQYNRIADNEPVEVVNNQAVQLQQGAEYAALTYNIGFGAYNHDFSFFMDAGVMQDGTPVQGKYARAQSEQIALGNTEGAIADAKVQNADFLLFQEVDVNSTRSFHIDQCAALENAFSGYGAAFTLNFHSAFLAYPLTEPHGAVQSGLLTLSAYNVESAVRRSYPVDDGFPTKFFDLDRCFEVLRLPVEGSGHELVLINSHMSAYDKGGLIRAQQLDMLAGVMEEERAAGNWVIVGGDFNHALEGSEALYPTQQQQPEWVSVLDESELPEGFSVVKADNVATVATCRSTDMPYEPGVNYTVTVDGFWVSDNVAARAENVNLDFTHSDHNPVRLVFTLE